MPRKKKKSVRKCGICREPGHTRDRCPHHDSLPSTPRPRSYGRPKAVRPPEETSPKVKITPKVKVSPRESQVIPHTDVEFKHIDVFRSLANNIIHAQHMMRGSVIQQSDIHQICIAFSKRLYELVGCSLFPSALELLHHLHDTDELSSIVSAIESLITNCGGSLIIPAAGDPFDYNQHRAVAVDPSQTAAEQAVTQTLSCGLRFKGRFDEAQVAVTGSRKRRFNPVRRHTWKHREPRWLRRTRFPRGWRNRIC